MLSKILASIVLSCNVMHSLIGMEKPKHPPVLPSHIDFIELCGQAPGMKRLGEQLNTLWKNLLMEKDVQAVIGKTNKIFRIRYIQINKTYIEKPMAFFLEADEINLQKAQLMIKNPEFEELRQEILSLFTNTYCAFEEGIPVIKVLKEINKQCNESVAS